MSAPSVAPPAVSVEPTRVRPIGVLAQSTLFIAVFYGIQVIWERDAGVLAKLLVTPTPRSALVSGKAFAANILLDLGVLAGAVVVAITVASALLPRLVR